MPDPTGFDPDAQVVYAELRRRGVLAADPDAHVIAQELVRRGVTHDLSGGTQYPQQAPPAATAPDQPAPYFSSDSVLPPNAPNFDISAPPVTSTVVPQEPPAPTAKAATPAKLPKMPGSTGMKKGQPVQPAYSTGDIPSVLNPIAYATNIIDRAYQGAVNTPNQVPQPQPGYTPPAGVGVQPNTPEAIAAAQRSQSQAGRDPAAALYSTLGIVGNAASDITSPIARAPMNVIEGGSSNPSAIFDPGQAWDALIHDTGAQKLGRELPELAPGTAAGNAYNLIGEAMTNPLNLAMAPRNLNVSKLTDLKQYIAAQSALSDAQEAGATEDVLKALQKKVATTSTGKALAAARPSIADTTIDSFKQDDAAMVARGNAAIRGASTPAPITKTQGAAQRAAAASLQNDFVDLIKSGDPQAGADLAATTIYKAPDGTYRPIQGYDGVPVKFGDVVQATGKDFPPDALHAAVVNMSSAPVEDSTSLPYRPTGYATSITQEAERIVPRPRSVLGAIGNKLDLPGPEVPSTPTPAVPEAAAPVAPPVSDSVIGSPEFKAFALGTSVHVDPSTGAMYATPQPGTQPLPMPAILQAAQSGHLPMRVLQNAVNAAAQQYAIRGNQQATPTPAPQVQPAAPTAPAPTAAPVATPAAAANVNATNSQNAAAATTPAPTQVTPAAPAPVVTETPAQAIARVEQAFAKDGVPISKDSPDYPILKHFMDGVKQRMAPWYADNPVPQSVLDQGHLLAPQMKKWKAAQTKAEGAARTAALADTTAAFTAPAPAPVAPATAAAPSSPAPRSRAGRKPKVNAEKVAAQEQAAAQVATQSVDTPLSPAEREEYAHYVGMLAKVNRMAVQGRAPSPQMIHEISTLGDKYSARYEALQAQTPKVVSAKARTVTPTRIPGINAPAVNPRIEIAPLAGTPSRSNADIVLDLSKGIACRISVTKNKSNRAGAAGGYFPGTSGVRIAYRGDINAITHEVGHAVIDKNGVMAEYKDQPSSPYDAELLNLAVHGSEPPKETTDPQLQLDYRRGEGMAEWVRAYILNPDAAKAAAPDFTKYALSKISKPELAAFHAFSDDIRKVNNLSDIEKVQRHIVTADQAEKAKKFPSAHRVLQMIGAIPFEQGLNETTGTDKFRAAWTDRIGPVITAWHEILTRRGENGEHMVLPENDFPMIAAAHNYNAGNIEYAMQHGIASPDDKTRLLTPSLERVFTPFDSLIKGKSAKQADKILTESIGLTLAYLTARTVVERAANIDEDTTKEVEAKADQIDARLHADVAAFEKVQRRVGTARFTGSTREQLTRIRERAAAAIKIKQAAVEAAVRAEFSVRKEWQKVDANSREKMVATETKRRQNAILDQEMRRLRVEYKAADRIARAEGVSPAVAAARRAGYKSRSKKRSATGTALLQSTEAQRLQRERVKSVAAAASIAKRQSAAEQNAAAAVFKVSAAAKARAASKSATVIAKTPSKIDRFVDSTTNTYRNNRAAAAANRLTRFENVRRERDTIHKANMAGFGMGLERDDEVAAGAVKIIDDLQASKPDLYAMVQASAKGFDEIAKGLLQYLVEMKYMNQSDVDKLVARNQQYSSLKRVMEGSPLYVAPHGPSRTGSLANAQQLFFNYKGSVRQIQDPISSLMNQFYITVAEADRNNVMRALVQKLESPTGRGMLDGEPTPFEDIGFELKEGETHPGMIKVMLERPVKNPDTGKMEPTIVPTNWVFPSPEVTKGLKNLGGGDVPMALAPARGISRFTHHMYVKMSAGFKNKHLLRGAQGRLMKSGSAAITHNSNLVKGIIQEAKDSFVMPTEADQRTYATRGAGLNRDFFLGGIENWDLSQNRFKKQVLTKMRGGLPASIQKVNFTKEEVFHMAESGPRFAELRSATRKAMEEFGYNEKNAEIYAANEARNVGGADYMRSGNVARFINLFNPFFTAGIAHKTNYYTFLRKLKRQGRYALLAGHLAVRVALAAAQYFAVAHQGPAVLKEFLDIPAYARDMFYWVKNGPNTWTAVPKDRDTAIETALITRIIDRGLGNKDAFEGFTEHAVREAAPMQEDQALAGPLHSIVEAIANYDLYRGKAIIPGEENDLALELRHTENASRLGKGVQKMTGIDSRKDDFLISAFMGDFGRQLEMASDIGRPDKTRVLDRLARNMSGVIRDSPGYDAVSVQKALLASKNYGANIMSGKPLESLSLSASPESIQKAMIAHAAVKTFSADTNAKADMAKAQLRRLMSAPLTQRILATHKRDSTEVKRKTDAAMAGAIAHSVSPENLRAQEKRFKQIITQAVRGSGK